MKIKQKVLKEYKYKREHLPFGDVARDIALRFNEELNGAIDLTLAEVCEVIDNWALFFNQEEHKFLVTPKDLEKLKGRLK